jgi:hypothetical protein
MPVAKRELVDFNIYPICHIFGRRLTAIFEPEIELRCQSVTAAVSRGFFDSDVGPQLALGGSFRAGDQVTRGNPQKDSGESENNCERGNYRFGVVVGEMSQTNAIDVERDRERGNTFLKILGGGVAILLLNAGLEWLGTFNNRPHGR